MSFGKLASVWPFMAFHYLSGHGRHALALSAQMRFASNSLYHTIAKKVKHKSRLGSFPIGRRLRGCFPYTTPPTESFLLCRFFGVARTTLLCCVGILVNGSFLHLPFDCKIQNWGWTILHLAGQVCSQLIDYAQSHWHKSTNLSVCWSLNLLSFESQCDWQESAANRQLEWKYMRMTSLHRRRSHPVAARKGIWFICATSARDGRTFPSPNLRPNIILQHPS